jgi:rubrerythrin
MLTKQLPEIRCGSWRGTACGERAIYVSLADGTTLLVAENPHECPGCHTMKLWFVNRDVVTKCIECWRGA